MASDMKKIGDMAKGKLHGCYFNTACSASSTSTNRKGTKTVPNAALYRKKVLTRLEELATTVNSGRALLKELDGCKNRHTSPLTDLESLKNMISSANPSDRKFLLMCAIYYNQKSLFQSLSGNFRDFVQRNKSEDSYLEMAVKLNSSDIVGEILDGWSNNSLQDLEFFYAAQESSLTAVQMDHVASLRHFYTHGLLQEIFPGVGRSPIHVAVECMANKCLEYLLSLDFPVNSLDLANNTPLMSAAAVGNLTAVEMLLSKDCQKEARDLLGRTALHIAADRGDVSVVQKLIEAGAIVTALEGKKYSPLMMACFRGYKEVADLLLRRGADVNECEHYSPLHAAARGNHVKVIGLLLEKGANLGIKNVDGETALEWIVKYSPKSMSEVTDLLDEGIALGDGVENTEEFILDFRRLFFSSGAKETSLLVTLANLGQHEVLNHPLCQAFIHFKWRKIPKFVMYSFVAIYIFYLALLFTYVDMRFISGSESVERIKQAMEEKEEIQKKLEQKGATSGVSDNHLFNALKPKILNITEIEVDIRQPAVSGIRPTDGFIGRSEDLKREPDKEREKKLTELIRTLLLIIIFGFLLTELFQLFGDPSDYLRDFSNYLSITNILLTSTLCFCNGREPSITVTYSASFVVLFASWEMLFVTAHIPAVGIYIQMFFKAVTNMGFFMLSFLVLVSGFGMSLAVVFRAVQFQKFPFYFLTSYVMMVGEFDYKSLFFEDDKLLRTSQIDPTLYALALLLLAFILVVVITLTNLLVGLAVSDTQDIYNSALGFNNVMRIRRLHVIEQTLIYSRFPVCERLKRRFFRRFLLFPDVKGENFLIDTQDPKWKHYGLPKEICEGLRRCKNDSGARVRKEMETQQLIERQKENHEILQLVKELKVMLQQANGQREL